MATVRVWAEERGTGALLLTWAWPEDTPERDQAADARAVAATVGVRPGVRSTQPAEGGVLVEYDPAEIGKPELAAALRIALAQGSDLKTRLGETARRTGTYLSLAKTLALDERISPVPEAARAAATRRATPAAMIPGFNTVAKLQALVPVLRSLSTWSRTAPPGVVEEHLEAVGLSREMLDADLATTQEGIAFAKDYATQTAGRAARKVGALASQARDRSREYIEQRQQQRRPPEE